METVCGTDPVKIVAMCTQLENLFANRSKAACGMFKTKLTEFMAKGGKEFRYLIYDANLKEFSDEIQQVAACYAQWETMRAFNKVSGLVVYCFV